MVILTSIKAKAQTYYVDPLSGQENATGSRANPLLSIEKAVALADHAERRDTIHIRLAPGLYILKSKLVIRTAQKPDRVPYIIEAAVMPDDQGWEPGKMPVIQTIGGVNDTIGFSHAVGLSVEKDNVSLLGLKFLGNPNSSVENFYPIRRAGKLLSGLTVSQCVFVGEANSSPIQSAFWVSGPGIHVDHCIFHNCKIAFVLGSEVNDFSLTNTIIDGAYNTAIWYGFAGNVPSFNFSGNVITNSSYVMVYPQEKGQPNFRLKNSYLAGNDNLFGAYPKEQDRFFSESRTALKLVNTDLKKIISFVKVQNSGITHDNLNISSPSDARTIKAGLFKADTKKAL